MAQLAIKGHSTRGKEIIEILEMLGGKNVVNHDGSHNRCFYFLDTTNIICNGYGTGKLVGMDSYTLEEFEEKYPYKVGDKVILDEIPCTITWMCWECNNIYYQVQGIDDVFTKKVTADELKLYKERNNMGKKLAIKGHPTRGEEVIQLLEMLGGTNDYFKHDGKIESFYYYIGDFNNHIYQCGLPSEMKCFTLEEFLEKYPYKVGDKVVFKFIDTYVTDTIKSMEWYANGVVYTLKEYEEELMAEDLQPFKEETVEEDKDTIEHTTEINLNHPCFDGHNKIELIIPENWKFEQIDNKMFGVRKYPQYPTTYEECWRMLGLGIIEDDYVDDYVCGYKQGVLGRFQQLLTCRDAYWKIAGEQMGLDKPWEPDWDNLSTNHEFVKINKGCFTYSSRVLVFPTKDMRDAFYENFKDLINECKELL